MASTASQVSKRLGAAGRPLAPAALWATRERAMWQAGVLGLVALRLGMWWLFQHDVPRMTEHYQWRFYHGGDESLYVQLAQEIVDGNVRWHYLKDIPVTVGVGLPLLFAGLMKFTGAHDYQAFLPLVVIGNGLFLGLLSVAVMAQLARALTGSRLQALWVGACWTLLPYLLWVGFGVHPDAALLRNAYVSRQMWVSGITDGPSLLFTLLGTLLALWGVQTLRRGRPAQAALLAAAGLCLGFGMAIRIHVLSIAAVVIVALLASRRWTAAGWVAAGMGIGFSPQLWHNAIANGHPLNTPYFQGWIAFSPPAHLIDTMVRDGWRFLGPAHGFAVRLGGAPFSPGFLVENLARLSERLPLLVMAALVIAVLGVYAFVRCWRSRGPTAALIMFGAPVSSFAIHVVTFVYVADPVRFTLPAVSVGLPAVMWTGATVVDVLYRRVRRLARPATL